MKFAGNYKDKPAVPAVTVSEAVITEQTGYMTTKQLVEQMVLAGQRLYDYRHGLLDHDVDQGMENDEEDFDQPPSRPYDRDMVEEQEDIEERLYEQQNKKAEKSAVQEEAKQGREDVVEVPKKESGKAPEQEELS